MTIFLLHLQYFAIYKLNISICVHIYDLIKYKHHNINIYTTHNKIINKYMKARIQKPSPLNIRNIVHYKQVLRTQHHQQDTNKSSYTQHTYQYNNNNIGNIGNQHMNINTNTNSYTNNDKSINISSNNTTTIQQYSSSNNNSKFMNKSTNNIGSEESISASEVLDQNDIRRILPRTERLLVQTGQFGFCLKKVQEDNNDQSININTNMNTNMNMRKDACNNFIKNSNTNKNNKNNQLDIKTIRVSMKDRKFEDRTQVNVSDFGQKLRQERYKQISKNKSYTKTNTQKKQSSMTKLKEYKLQRGVNNQQSPQLMKKNYLKINQSLYSFQQPQTSRFKVDGELPIDSVVKQNKDKDIEVNANVKNNSVSASRQRKQQFESIKKTQQNITAHTTADTKNTNTNFVSCKKSNIVPTLRLHTLNFQSDHKKIEKPEQPNYQTPTIVRNVYSQQKQNTLNILAEFFFAVNKKKNIFQQEIIEKDDDVCGLSSKQDTAEFILRTFAGLDKKSGAEIEETRKKMKNQKNLRLKDYLRLTSLSNDARFDRYNKSLGHSDVKNKIRNTITIKREQSNQNQKRSYLFNKNKNPINPQKSIALIKASLKKKLQIFTQATAKLFQFIQEGSGLLENEYEDLVFMCNFHRIYQQCVFRASDNLDYILLQYESKRKIQKQLLSKKNPTEDDVSQLMEGMSPRKKGKKVLDIGMRYIQEILFGIHLIKNQQSQNEDYVIQQNN